MVDEPSAIGFTVKSGWTSAVVVGGTRAAPRVLDARRLDLSDPALPASRQPYHAGFGTARVNDPARIANAHIRIHALEGQLFRRVVEHAAAEHRLACHTWRERDLYAVAASFLRRSEPELRATLAGLGRSVEGPWRVEQKAAALAAWLALAGAC